jgi:hypothetical protein
MAWLSIARLPEPAEEDPPLLEEDAPLVPELVEDDAAPGTWAIARPATTFKQSIE